MFDRIVNACIDRLALLRRLSWGALALVALAFGIAASAGSPGETEGVLLVGLAALLKLLATPAAIVAGTGYMLALYRLNRFGELTAYLLLNAFAHGRLDEPVHIVANAAMVLFWVHATYENNRRISRRAWAA